MATVKLALRNLPSRASDAQIRQSLSPLGRIESLKRTSAGCLITMDSSTIREIIDSSGIGELPLGSIRMIDSAGLGELTNAILRLA